MSEGIERSLCLAAASRDSELETGHLTALAPDDHTVRLNILEKRLPAADQQLPPLLFVHGATFAASIFDLPRPGYSMLGAMAKARRAAYAIDIRGYGRSSAPRIIDAPEMQNLPFAGSDTALLDLTTAIELVLKRHATTALDLVGFSWGAMLAARYACQHASKIRKLVLYAPMYRQANLAALGRMAALASHAVAYGAYGLVTLADVIQRWNSGLPNGNVSAYREDGIPELLFSTLAALDPKAAHRAPPAFRCPRGPLSDLIRVAGGRALFNPAGLTMPTLLVRGVDDTTSIEADCRDLLAEISSTDKAYATIPGSHFLLLEKTRFALYEKLISFFAAECRENQSAAFQKRR